MKVFVGRIGIYFLRLSKAFQTFRQENLSRKGGTTFFVKAKRE